MNLQKIFRYFIRAKVLFLFTFSEFCDIISSPIGGYMEVLIDNDLNELDKLDYLGSGMEGMVYRYYDEAIKVYKTDCSKYILDVDTASRLSLIETSRILLPRRIVYSPEDGSFLGYTTKYIEKGPKSDVFRKNVNRFCDELDVLRDDITLLSNDKVLLEDLIIGNTVFNNGSIFLIDPGSYRFINGSEDDVLYSNLWEFRDFIAYDLLGSVAYSRRRKELIKEIFLGYEMDVCDIMRETTTVGETVKQYVKRITK